MEACGLLRQQQQRRQASDPVGFGDCPASLHARGPSIAMLQQAEHVTGILSHPGQVRGLETRSTFGFQNILARDTRIDVLLSQIRAQEAIEVEESPEQATSFWSIGLRSHSGPEPLDVALNVQ